MMKVELPGGYQSPFICEICLASPRFSRCTEEAIAFWCEHRHSGGILRLSDGYPVGCWYFFIPVSLEQFSEIVAYLQICDRIDKTLQKGRLAGEMKTIPNWRLN